MADEERSSCGLRRLAGVACVWVWLVTLATPAGASLVTPGAQLVVVLASPRFFEGPAWDPRTARLYFTSLTGGGQILQLEPPTTVRTWLENTQGINGTFLSLDGRLLCAQGDTRRIISMGIGFDGPEDMEVLAADPAWKMPNDLCQTPGGDIYFTTPFGSGTGSYVYRLAPDKTVTPVITDMVAPNGIIASNDGWTLYVADSTMKWWRAYPILPGGGVGSGAVFFNPSTPNQNDPDGMAIDELGNLYFSGRGGVWIVSPQGQQLEMISVAESCANVDFGGVDGRTLYLTCDGKVYSLSMEVRGALWGNMPLNNQPPQVNGGPDQTVTSRTPTVLLAGNASDDHLPDPPGALSVEWSKASGPGTANFGDPSAAQTTATFSAVGTYVLRLWAFDGIRSAVDEVTVIMLRVADFDNDGDVDLGDVTRFLPCWTGAGQGPPAAGCEGTDVDQDGDVDQSDFGLVQRCLSGTGTPSDPHCAD